MKAEHLSIGQTVILSDGFSTRRAVVQEHCHAERFGHWAELLTEDGERETIKGESTEQGIGWKVDATRPAPQHDFLTVGRVKLEGFRRRRYGPVGESRTEANPYYKRDAILQAAFWRGWDNAEELIDARRVGECESREAARTTDWDYGRE